MRLNFEKVLSVLQGVIRIDDTHAKACCPAHADHNPSLLVNLHESGGVSYKCLAGCDKEAIKERLVELCGGEDVSSRIETPRAKSRPKFTVTHTYDYRDAHGVLIAQVLRGYTDDKPKEFRQRRPDTQAAGKWLYSVSGIQVPIYMLPEMLSKLDAEPETPVYLVDGEKDVQTLWQHGLTATCNCRGGGAFEPHNAQQMAKVKMVYIIPDLDARKTESGAQKWPGMDQAKIRAQRLTDIDVPCKIVMLPDHIGDAKVKDATDYFSAGGTVDALEAIAVSTPVYTAKKSKPTVRLPGADYNNFAFVEQLGRVFAKQTVLFRRGETIVSISELSTAAAKFSQVTPDAASSLMECVATFYKLKKMGDDVIESVHPISQTQCAIALSSAQLIGSLPTVDDIVDYRAPYIGTDGRLSFTRSGYNADIACYASRRAVEDSAPDIALPDALDYIRTELLADFCVEDEEVVIMGTAYNRRELEYAAMLTYLLTPYCKLFFKGQRAPIFVSNGNRSGVGKDYILGLAPIIVNGCMPTFLSPLENDDEEMRKRLFTAAIESLPYCLISNVNGLIKYPSLESYATDANPSERILGSQVSRTVRNSSVYAISGNQIRFANPDMHRRLLEWHLVYNESSLVMRKFTHADLWAWAMQHRAKLLACLRAIVQNYFAVGAPRVDRVRQGFTAWSIVPKMVECAGFVNPLVVDLEDAPADESEDNFCDLLKIIHDSPTVIETTALTVSDFVSYAFKSGLFPFIRAVDADDRAALTKFGAIIARYERRQFGDLCVVRVSNRRPYKYNIINYDTYKYKTQKRG